MTTQRTRKKSVEICLAMLGSVCGTIVTATAQGSPTITMAGAALGAAIPPFIGTVDRHRPLRLLVACAIAASALFFTYSGFTVVAYAAQQPGVFPDPPGLPPPVATTVHPPKDEFIAIEVTGEVDCHADGCDQRVTVTSAGTLPLRIGDIELTGQSATQFGHKGDCAGRTLGAGQQCGVDVTYRPSGPEVTEKASLVIHQNLPGDPTIVTLTGHGPARSRLDLLASRGSTTCAVKPSSVPTLQLSWQLRMTGNEDGAKAPSVVTVGVRSDTGLKATYITPVRQLTTSTAVLRLRPEDVNRSHVITIAVDPDNAITEANEANNRVVVSVKLSTGTVVATAPPSMICQVRQPS